ncbi:MAG: ribonuclease HII [Ardenticatenaceae bacterium]
MLHLSSEKLTPSYKEEASLLAQGYSLVAGLDEVGRGPLAGPVVAGVVVLPPNPRGRWVKQVRDSKQLSALQRERVLPYIQDAALAVEIGVSDSHEVDALGIVEATRLAMARALNSLALLPEFLLLDALSLPAVSIPQKAIIHGDALCLSIAAASIVAKVERDKMMECEDSTHPGYGFAQHKGYGTRAHFESLHRLGPCPIHRTSFSPIKEMVNSLL